MSDRNPIPYCLSHLTQRDAAVRARAIELPDNVSAASDLLSDYILQCEGGHDDESDARAAFRIIDRHLRLIPTPPAPTPDEAAIRAELVAALREFVYETTHLSTRENDGSHWCRIRVDVLNNARAALARATS